jgi:hypothetical protein
MKIPAPSLLGILTSLLCLVDLGQPVFAQPPELDPGILGVHWGESPDVVEENIAEFSRSLEFVVVDPPRFPLAAEHEAHLIARDYRSDDGFHVDAVAFTFADGKLVQIEARGGAIIALMPRAIGDAHSYEGYVEYPRSLLFARPKEDVVWLLTPPGLHPHLYLWDNPYISAAVDSVPTLDISAVRPDFLEFGEELNELLPRMQAACRIVQREQVPKPWLPTEPAVQVAVNCFGVVFAGFPRKLETAFGDGTLQLGWMGTAAQEEPRVRQALVEAYGEPEYVNDSWEAFQGWTVALRKDVPEVYFISERLAPVYQKRFEGAGTGAN